MWIKKGRIYGDGHAQLPTPVLLRDRIRIYFSDRAGGKSYIRFLDVRTDLPSESIGNASGMALSPGQRGCFDDSGVMPSCAVEIASEVYIYYTGWNLDKGQVPYGHGIGIAKCTPEGSLERIYNGPILDRSASEPFLCNSPYVARDGDGWRMVYCSGTGWIRDFPSYSLREARSIDGHKWEVGEYLFQGESFDPEEALSRPCISGAAIYFASRKYDTPYRLETYVAGKGRRPGGLELSADGWDSEMICYPYIIEVGSRRYLFYNGNGYGASGFGYAEWKD
jgi:hypothetical protein